jgi:hypothetical protein
MAPADAPANSETEAVAENVSEETEMAPADASNTSEVEAVVEEEVAEMEMAPADAPANSETEAVAENVSEETEMAPADASNTSEVEAVVEEQVAEMEMAPADAPANSETEAVAENVSEETEMAPADASNTSEVEEVGVPEGTGMVCEGNNDLSADAVTEKEPVLDEAEKEETLKSDPLPVAEIVNDKAQSPPIQSKRKAESQESKLVSSSSGAWPVVGQRVCVWFDGEKSEGLVTKVTKPRSKRAKKGKIYVEYDDGDEGYCDYPEEGIELLDMVNAEDVGCKAETTAVIQKKEGQEEAAETKPTRSSKRAKTGEQASQLYCTLDFFCSMYVSDFHYFRFS